MNVSSQALGYVPGVTNDEYHNGHGVSKTHLDDMAEPNSPMHYFHAHLDPNREVEEKTPALILGDAIHKAVLEPDLVSTYIMEIPEDAPKRPSITQINAKKPSLESQGAIAYWRDFSAEHKGKLILKKDDMDIVMSVRDAVHRHPEARGLFMGGKSEQAYYSIDPDTGELIKCKVDYSRIEDAGMMIDLKTTESASEESFGKSAWDYRYHVQGGFYPHVVNSHYGPGIVEEFVFVAIEKKPPWAIGIYYMEPAYMAEGLAEGLIDLRKIAKCRAANHWPDFGTEPKALHRPSWAKIAS